MPLRDDEQLMLHAAAGDRAAFGELVERHHRAVVRFVYRFLGDADMETAEDLAQDVFLSALRAAGSFEPRAKVFTWLLRLATNACLNHRRSRRLRRMFSLSARDDRADRHPHGPAADSSLVSAERAAAVQAAIGRLPAAQRAAIILRHYHDLSYGEISDVLETSVSAVESLLFRARSKLRTELAAQENPDSPQVSPLAGSDPG